jgi:hypothetical protein
VVGQAWELRHGNRLYAAALFLAIGPVYFKYFFEGTYRKSTLSEDSYFPNFSLNF